MDKFPEAFERFEKDVNVNKIESFKQLELEFESWSGKKWKGTSKQVRALEREARRLGIPLTGVRKVSKALTSKEQQRLVLTQIEQEEQAEWRKVKFSSNYSNFQQWQSKTARTTAYQRRIANYMQKHPNANLQQARGHAKKR